jgi:transcriptional regulator with PAS, ATPase and Fis domain
MFKYVHAMSLINYDIIVITLLVIHLLLIAGDIELNPGPKGTPDLIETVLSIYHGNIRSLRNKINYIANLIEEYNIVFATETHLNNQITDDDIAISGFDIPFRKDRNSHGGGIIMYHKSNIKIINSTLTGQVDYI